MEKSWVMAISFQKRGSKRKLDENGATRAAMDPRQSTLGQRFAWQRWERRFARLGEDLVRIPGQRFFVFEKILS